MRDHRRSFFKTTIAALVVMAADVLALLVVLKIESALGSIDRWGRWLPWATVVLFAAALVWPSLVLWGGVIALERDAFEERGAPYVRTDAREWLPGAPMRVVRNAMRALFAVFRGRAGLRAGDVVRVKNLEEIQRTLDDRGCLDGLPFMPEMVSYCGQRLRVFRRVDKLHDWIGRTGLRRMRSTVMLVGPRCTGDAHGGCQARCHLRWKEAWLERVSGEPAEPPATPATADALASLARHASRLDQMGVVHYRCQATELTANSTPLAWGDARHYLRDLVTGNVRFTPLLRGVAIRCFNWLQRARGGISFPYYVGTAPGQTPVEQLDLQVGELVRIKTKREIEPTINGRYRNRGLWFDADGLRYCGGQYRVLARVDRQIREHTGEMLQMKTPGIILEGVTATGEYLAFNPENDFIYWREIWLERVTTPAGVSASP